MTTKIRIISIGWREHNRRYEYNLKYNGILKITTSGSYGISEVQMIQITPFLYGK